MTPEASNTSLHHTHELDIGCAALGKRVLEAGMSLGLAASGVDGPLRSWREQKLKGIFQSGSSLRLQFPKEDLGFSYNSPGAAVILAQDDITAGHLLSLTLYDDLLAGEELHVRRSP